MKMEISTNWIVRQARAHGFHLAGVAAVETMDPEPLRRWLAAGYAAEMSFLHRHAPLRANIAALLPGALSVICVAVPYPGPSVDESCAATVAKYARCADYHDLIRVRLHALWQEIATINVDAKSRIFVDSGPLPERELARRAGLGWVGKHSCLIHPDYGSRFCLGEILTTLELQPTTAMPEQCGACQACLDACPTGALISPGIVDARRCFSYLTIEHRGPIPRELRPFLGARLFGCDTCQDACPYNRTLKQIASPLLPVADWSTLDPCVLLRLSPAEFKTRFRGAALARAKRRGLLRNACVVLGNRRDSAAIPILCAALRDEEPLVRGHAAWALGQLGARDPLRAALRGEEDPWVVEEIEQALLG
jgi:epoxyqueuosine reductase